MTCNTRAAGTRFSGCHVTRANATSRGGCTWAHRWRALGSLILCFRAYRRKALLWHPDKLEQNKSEDGFYMVDGEKVDKARAEAMFKDLNEANEVLTDPTKKRR